MQGCQMLLANFLQVFKIYFMFLKLHVLWSTFVLKLRSNIYLNSIQQYNNIEKMCVSFFKCIRKKIYDNKNFLSIQQIFCVKSKFYYLICKSCLKFQIFSDFCSKFKVFFFNFKFQVFQGLFNLNCQIPGFSRILGFLATLIKLLKNYLIKI